MKKRITKFITVLLVSLLLFEMAPLSGFLGRDWENSPLLNTIATKALASTSSTVVVSDVAASGNLDDVSHPSGKGTFYYKEWPYLNMICGKDVYVFEATLYIKRSDGSVYATKKWSDVKAEQGWTYSGFHYWAQPMQMNEVGSFSAYFELTYNTNGWGNSTRASATSGTVQFSVIDRTPVLQCNVSSVNLDVNSNPSQTIYFWHDESLSYSYNYWWDRGSNRDFSCEWQDWENNKSPLVITGIRSVSNQPLTVTIKKRDDESVVASKTIYVNVTAPTYTVSYSANGGSGAPASQTKQYNRDLTLSSTTPSKYYTVTCSPNASNLSQTTKDYSCTFLRWNTNSSGNGTNYYPGDTYTSNSGMSLYAQWQNPVIGTLPTLSRSGYTFEGWYTSPTGGEKITSSYVITGNTTIYAHWKTAIYYTVTYDANGGSNPPAPQQKPDGEKISLSPESPSRTGYSFMGWSLDPNASSVDYAPDGSFSLNKDTVLYAVWQGKTYTVNFNPNNGSCSFSNTTVTYGSEYGTLPTAQRTGYSFAGWYTSREGGTRIYATSQVSYDYNHTLYAHWSGLRRTIVFDAAGGTVSPSAKSVNNGEAYGVLPQPSYRGHLFQGWFTKEENGEEITKNSVVSLDTEETQRLFAVWEPDYAAVTLPVVENTATNITKDSVVLKGTVVSDGGADITAKTFYYYEKSGAVYSVAADDNFQCTLSNLKPGTTYWFFAAAENIMGVGYGVAGSFVTLTEDSDAPNSVAIIPAIGLSLNVGKTGQLTAQVQPNTAANKSVVWSSADPSIATVSQTGLVTAKKGGKTSITVTTEVGRLVASCPVRVLENDTDIDLSEWNMATNTSNRDPEGWDVDSKDVGGNVQRAISYLSRWDGPVYEADDPFLGSNYLEKDAAFHVQDVQFLRSRTGPLDNDEIKGALVSYGAVMVSICNLKQYYKEETCSFYNPNVNDNSNGHAVAIVGWDDDYPAENFATTPPGNGAFLCKNSWGTDFGDNGYFWTSYYDTKIGKRNINAVFNGIESNDNYNKIYQYDPMGPVGTFPKDGNCSEIWMSNVFLSTEKENLEAVSFYTYDKGTRYEIYILNQWENINSFEGYGAPAAIGTMEYAGYHTVKLPDKIPLTQNNRFAVVIHLSGEKTSAYVELPIQGSGYNINATANASESFYSRDGKLWVDLTDEAQNANFCIKAFTDGTSVDGNSFDGAVLASADSTPADSVPTVQEYMEKGFLFNPDFVKAQSTASLFSAEDAGYGDDLVTITVGDSSTIDYLDGAQYSRSFDLRNAGDVSGVKHQGSTNCCWAFAAMASLESCLLRAGKADSYQMQNGLSGISYISSIDMLGTMVGATLSGGSALSLSRTSAEMYVGQTDTLSATVNLVSVPVVWSSSATDVVKVDTGGNINAVSPGKAVVTAETSDGRTASCNITVKAAANVGIALEKSQYDCNIGDVLLLNYTIKATNADSITLKWTSSAPTIAKVDPVTGRITALKEGKTTISVDSSDGKMHADSLLVVSGNGLCSITGYKSLVRSDNILSGNVSLRIANPTVSAVKATAYITIVNSTGNVIDIESRKISLAASETKTVYLKDLLFSNVPETYSVDVYLVDDNSFRPLSMKVKM